MFGFLIFVAFFIAVIAIFSNSGKSNSTGGEARRNSFTDHHDSADTTFMFMSSGITDGNNDTDNSSNAEGCDCSSDSGSDSADSCSGDSGGSCDSGDSGGSCGCD